MKKLFLYVFLSLLWCNVGFADQLDITDKKTYSKLEDVKLEMSTCENIRVRKNRREDEYNFNISNLNKKKLKIEAISFLTKDNDIIRIEPVLKTIDRFHKKYITVSTPDLLHGYVETIIINCSIKK